MTAYTSIKHGGFINNEERTRSEWIDAVGSSYAADIKTVYCGGLGKGDSVTYFTEEGKETITSKGNIGSTG